MIFALQVRFFYSFTSRDNLYLVMEYLNGGDLYSLLKTVGCLEEAVARTYLAELVNYEILYMYKRIILLDQFVRMLRNFSGACFGIPSFSWNSAS